MSYERTSECFKDVYGLPISQGSVQNLLERFANKAALVYGKIQKNVFKAKVVGADEAGVKINGKKSWYTLGKIHLIHLSPYQRAEEVRQ